MNFNDRFIALRAANGDALFDDEGMYIIDAMLDDAKTYGTPQDIYAHFATPHSQIQNRTKWQHWSAAVYSIKSYDHERNAREVDYENFLNRGSAPVDTNQCPQCGHNNTMHGLQNRAGDESGTTTSRCKNCNAIYNPE